MDWITISGCIFHNGDLLFCFFKMLFIVEQIHPHALSFPKPKPSVSGAQAVITAQCTVEAEHITVTANLETKHKDSHLHSCTY